MFDINEAVQLFNSQVQRSNQFWSFYSGVALGAIGLSLSRGNDKHANLARVILTAVFVAFAVQNCDALAHTHEGVQMITTRIYETACENKKLSATAPNRTVRPGFEDMLLHLNAEPPERVRRYHAMFDVATAVTIWVPAAFAAIVSLYRRRQQPVDAEEASWPA